jgi:hypothetical protein
MGTGVWWKWLDLGSTTHSSERHHPQRSLSSGGARDFAWAVLALRARSLAPLVTARGLGMTPQTKEREIHTMPPQTHDSFLTCVLTLSN